jgi:hypothetical protein
MAIVPVRKFCEQWPVSGHAPICPTILRLAGALLPRDRIVGVLSALRDSPRRLARARGAGNNACKYTLVTYGGRSTLPPYLGTHPEEQVPGGSSRNLHN